MILGVVGGLFASFLLRVAMQTAGQLRGRPIQSVRELAEVLRAFLSDLARP